MQTQINNNPQTKAEAELLLKQLLQTYVQLEAAMTDLSKRFDLDLDLFYATT